MNSYISLKNITLDSLKFWPFILEDFPEIGKTVKICHWQDNTAWRRNFLPEIYLTYNHNEYTLTRKDLRRLYRLTHRNHRGLSQNSLNLLVLIVYSFFHPKVSIIYWES